jgi:penicillin amidase
MTKFLHAPRALTVAVSVALTAMIGACGGGGDNASGDQTLTIKRDSYGVPHVYATTTRGLFYGFGYAVAEDRLFQMEMARRSVLGTASEVLGSSYVNQDISSRQVFDRNR